jgi:DNA-3-methyladenine glycosylase
VRADETGAAGHEDGTGLGHHAGEDSLLASRPLPASFYRKGTVAVARALLGCRLTRRMSDGTSRSVILVETEAYLGVKDRAAHTWNGRRTPRVEPMWGEGGHAYVYFVYGMHDCLNVVTQRAGVPEAVLLRAAVLEEFWVKSRGPKREASLKMKKGGRRSDVDVPSPPSKKGPLLLLSGPAKLCAYLEVTTALSGASFSGPELVLSRGPRTPFEVLAGALNGVDYAGAAARWPLRFAVAGCEAVTFRRRFGVKAS